VKPIEWQDFDKVDMRVGRVVTAREFPEARKPSYFLEIDFGADLGRRQTVAAIADEYDRDQMEDRLVVAVTNFPPKQIAKHMSEVLLLAAVNPDDSLRLLQPDAEVELGARIR
jgi:tRNA-binding protein